MSDSTKAVRHVKTVDVDFDDAEGLVPRTPATTTLPGSDPMPDIEIVKGWGERRMVVETIPWAKRRLLLNRFTAWVDGHRVVTAAADGVRVCVPGWLPDTRVENALRWLVLVEEVTFGKSWDGTRNEFVDVRTPGYGGKYHDMLPNQRLISLPFPKIGEGDDPELFVRCVGEWMQNKNVNLAYTSGGRVKVVLSDVKGWLKPWNNVNVEVTDGPKTEKRLKQYDRPYPLVGRFEGDEVRMVVIEGADLDERLYDGGFVMTRSLALEVFNRTEHFRKDKAARDLLVRRLKGRRGNGLFNARVDVFHGGQLKGNVVLVDAIDGNTGWVIKTHACNVKTETRGSECWEIGLDPQLPHDGVRTNAQLMTSLPQLFPVGEVKKWVTQQVAAAKNEIASGKVSEKYQQLADLNERRKKEGDTSAEDSHYLRTRFAAVELAEMGYDVRSFPSLVNDLFMSKVKGMWRPDRGKLNVNVPCAANEQIVSNTFVKVLMGLDLTVADGCLKRLYPLGLNVVSDNDWLRVIKNHGGCDQDDHFSLFFRTIDGRRKIVVMRDPSDVGEYSVFDPCPGDEFPTAVEWVSPTTAREVCWPGADLTGAPTMACDNATTRVVGLPKDNTNYGGKYTKATFFRNLRRALGGNNPGRVANAKMLYNMTFKRQRDVTLATMEEMVDACQQGGTVEQMKAIDAFAADLVEDVLNSGRCVDALFWTVKAFCPMAKGVRREEIVKKLASGAIVNREWFDKDYRDVNLVKGWFTELVVHTNRMIDLAANDPGRGLRKLAQRWVRSKEFDITPLLPKPTYKEVGELRGILFAYRNWFKDNQGATPREKEAEQQRVLEAVGEGRFAKFVQVVFNAPKKDGEVSESILWTKPFRDKFLDLLRQLKNPK